MFLIIVVVLFLFPALDKFYNIYLQFDKDFAKNTSSNLLKKVTYFLGIASASVLIGFPVQAQQSGGGVLNPRPSIFNEPPYNRSGGAATPPETSPAPIPDIFLFPALDKFYNIYLQFDKDFAKNTTTHLA